MSTMKMVSPLRRWEVLAGLCQSIDAKHLVEVGVKAGETTGFLLANLPDLHVTAIDPWGNVSNSAESYEDWEWKKIKRQFWTNVGENKARCTMLRQQSVDAARSVLKPVEIVFIDAAHDEENVLADIRAWWPKVREGGILCGHDYQHKFPGVHRAVARAFPLLQVAVMPDSVWCVNKSATLRMAA